MQICNFIICLCDNRCMWEDVCTDQLLSYPMLRWNWLEMSSLWKYREQILSFRSECDCGSLSARVSLVRSVNPGLVCLFVYGWHSPSANPLSTVRQSPSWELNADCTHRGQSCTGDSALPFSSPFSAARRHFFNNSPEKRSAGATGSALRTDLESGGRGIFLKGLEDTQLQKPRSTLV